ncbi:hypothetical protein ACET9X_04985 [Aeromonas veronii]
MVPTYTDFVELPRTSPDNKKPAKPYALRVSVLLRSRPEHYLVELGESEFELQAVEFNVFKQLTVYVSGTIDGTHGKTTPS